MAGWVTGFDADDTLWRTERAFRLTEERFADLLRDHVEAGPLRERLLEAERRNLGVYGFGVKGFVLSMIETAVEVTEGRVPASVIGELLGLGREMLAHPIELLPHAREAVEAARGNGPVVLVTKGDLLDQERKLAQSGLGDLFDAVEIVSRKSAATYARVFARHGAPSRAAMVGDSLRSDVIPALEAGAWGLHVSQGVPWALEAADAPSDHPRFRSLPDLSALAPLLHEIAADGRRE